MKHKIGILLAFGKRKRIQTFKPYHLKNPKRISFQKYSSEYNSEGIEYIVETSTDLRTWTTTGVTQVDLNGPSTDGNGVDVGGGMERVLYETTGTASSKGGKQFLRVRVRTK